MKYEYWSKFREDENVWKDHEAILTFQPHSNEVVKTNHRVTLKKLCSNDSSRVEYVDHEHNDHIYVAESGELVSIEIISKSKKNNMSITSLYKNLTRQEPEKSFVKAGVMDESLQFTSEGRELFLNFLLEKNKDDFKKEVVDLVIAEQEKDK